MILINGLSIILKNQYIELNQDKNFLYFEKSYGHLYICFINFIFETLQNFFKL